jgi:hypothetical protein
MKRTLYTLACSLLVLVCLTGGAAKDSAKDYHLVQAQMLDGGSDGKNPPTVFVLLFPDNTRPKVFERIESKELEAWLSGLPKGSVVHYEHNRWFPPVERAALDALKAACQKKSVSLVVDAPNHQLSLDGQGQKGFRAENF